MEMTGEFRIPAAREQVWEALNDPQILRQCIPGCQSIEKVSDTEFTAKIRSKVGPVQANFATRVSLFNLNPPTSYTIAGEGQGGVAGFAKGSADVTLEEAAGETLLRYAARFQAGGKLAQVGSRLLGGAARKLAADFFGNLATKLLGAPAAEEALAPETVTASAVPSGRHLHLTVWVFAVIVLIALLIWAFKAW